MDALLYTEDNNLIPQRPWRSFMKQLDVLLSVLKGKKAKGRITFLLFAVASVLTHSNNFKQYEATKPHTENTYAL